jgi:alkylation response protein AidB-like acyl-CoA dehydrogenase
MSFFRFEHSELPESAEVLRKEVRAFLAGEIASIPEEKRAQSWSGSSIEFSKKLGAKGWIGMTWPKKYGGHERSYLERYVVLEELLAAGAPVGAHWVADRQSGPLFLRFGTEEQRQAIVPRIAKGELRFCIGMSEPDSGSDLASVRTRAERTKDGWLVNGT